MSLQDKWLTIDEVCEHLRLGRTKIYELAQSGRIPASKLGGQWRFERVEVDEWIRGQRTDGGDVSENVQDYVHGYSGRESTRLIAQATTLTALLHSDTLYPAGNRVLEAGCGVGAQTVTLVRNSPDAFFISVDISEDSLTEARKNVAAVGNENVMFQRADIFDLPFEDNCFDHVFVCFVLEHLQDPVGALSNLRRVLKPGGTITVIEGDHGSVYFYPHSEMALRAVECQIELQARGGGDSLVGRSLYPLLVEAGFDSVQVSPRMVYVDASRPELVEGFTKKTFTAMVEGVREDAIAAGLTTPDEFDRGIADLYRTTQKDGTFCYTFFKAWGAGV